MVRGGGGLVKPWSSREARWERVGNVWHFYAGEYWGGGIAGCMTVGREMGGEAGGAVLRGVGVGDWMKWEFVVGELRWLTYFYVSAQVQSSKGMDSVR